jgi:hypothetical protein
MTNQVALPPNNNNNPFSSYGAKVGILGTYLSFKAGEFLVGKDGQTLPLGMKLLANMEGLRVGWKRWNNGLVTDDFPELMSEGKPETNPNCRNALGDLDESLWEDDDRGDPRDPWQYTNELVLQSLDGSNTYIFATSSKGGIGAIGRLCLQYGRIYKQKPGMTPVVELGNYFYMHQSYGKTYNPKFTIVDWVSDGTAPTPAEATPAKPPKPEPPKLAAPRPQLAEPKARTVVHQRHNGGDDLKTADDLDDEMPF